MTIKKLIKKLQLLDKKYPRTEVTVDITSRTKGMDNEWTHRSIEGIKTESIQITDGDGWSTEREKLVVALEIF